MVNASPDLPAQIQAFPALHPRPGSPRHSPVAGVFLTNADLDHMLGLFSLREGDPVDIYAPAAVRATAEDSLGLETVLNSFCGSHWHEPAFGEFALVKTSRGSSALRYRAIPLPGKPPRFEESRGTVDPAGHSVAYQFVAESTQKGLLIAPDVAAITPELLEALHSSDIILFDGTFWSAEELAGVKPGAPKATEMGHVTIQDGSLPVLARLSARAKVYIHVNNTNPVHDPHSRERAAVEAAGLIVGRDGMEFEL